MPWQSCANRNKTVILIKELNDFIVQFKINWSRFIKRFSLRSNLNLLESARKISKSSKFIVQFHCNRWSDIAA